LQALGFSEAMARVQMGRIVRQQAFLLGLNDAFLIGAAVFAVLAGVVWLASPARAAAPKQETRQEELERLEAEELMEQT
jgi:DHA2 family multidrug resistance protein